ncbi:hypothetical protein ACFXPS_00380 [Nocardia sp. NPDC059091]|uniref:hypothetical protein n=1 Tax=unclassified Nocardia TaxID=2637762 RepID=UPI0036A2F85F
MIEGRSATSWVASRRNFMLVSAGGVDDAVTTAERLRVLDRTGDDAGDLFPVFRMLVRKKQFRGRLHASGCIVGPRDDADPAP